mmetsp:Transcript_9032/g.8124  ORF Transcript_9032/g.8124 Transcript_9032/m.8124 type:complete len:269 (+) Transcript_9032:1-807(+)
MSNTTVSSESNLPSTQMTLNPVEINDLLSYIFLNLTPLELSSTISLVSKAFNQVVFNNKMIWLYYCNLLWKGKFFIIPRAIELKVSKPCDAFKISWIDRERNVINLKELTAMKWRFRIKKQYSFNLLTSNIDDNCGEDKDKMLAKFNTDGSLVHENVDFGGRQFKWKFVSEETTEENYDPFSLKRSRGFSSLNVNEFDINSKNSTNSNVQTCYGYEHSVCNDDEDDADNISLCKSRWIKVNEFPVLCAFRDENWGWILQNERVIFTSY